MKTQPLLFRLLCGAALGILCASTLVARADSSTIKLPLQNTGADPDATGRLTVLLKSSASQLTVEASRLTPGQGYTFAVGDVPEATLTADHHGRVRATFFTPAKKNRPALDFDPRGQVVSLRDGSNSVLQAVVSGSGEPSGITVDEKAKLTRVAGTGEATASYKTLRNGQRTFSVKLENVASGDWSVFVNGILRGTLNVHSRQSTLTFDSNPTKPGRLPLDFDPRGQVIDLGLGTNLMFTGKLEARAKNVNSATPSAALAYIPSTGVDADGTARARLSVDKNARRKFSVELEHVPAGAYEFLANGILQGSINVADVSGHTEGEIEFSSREDDGGELPLTFEPTNSVFLIQREAVVYFQGALSNSLPGGTNGGPLLMEENLTSTGLDSDASGEAKFEIDDRGRTKFSVEIEDVAVGAYELWVGGVKRGTISAALKDTKVKGELEFSKDDDSNKLPLTFEPRGQLIEVRNASGVFFSHLFGFGSTNGGGTNNPVALPMQLAVPLFNLGVAPGASAKAEFKSDDRGRRSFEVEIEDAPLGSYVLTVGGAGVGTISVVATDKGNRGRIEFEDDDDDGHLPLTFDPLGQTITITLDGVSYFERVFPTGN